MTKEQEVKYIYALKDRQRWLEAKVMRKQPEGRKRSRIVSELNALGWAILELEKTNGQ